MSTPKRTNAPNENARHGQGGGRGVAKTNYSKSNPTTLATALRYAEAGYRVLPLEPRGKKPRLREWTKAATADAKQIQAWWSKWPDSNLGLMPPEGCLVVDVDPRHGGSADGLDLPANTPTQRTGGGGMHYVVRIEDGAELPKREGIDYIRPGAQQFVAWPGVHPSGKQYEWEPGLAPWDLPPAPWVPPGEVAGAAQARPGGSPELAPLPLRQQKPPHLTCDQLRELGREVHAAEPDRWGQGRHDAWLQEWVMPVHYETGGSEEGRALAHEISETFSGYDRKALDAKWRSLGRHPGGEQRTGASLERLVFALRHVEKRESPHRGVPVEHVADFADAAQPPRWLLRGWLPTGVTAVLLGEANAGKSALAVALGMSVAAGSARFCGQEVRQHGAVLYVIAEGQHGMRARARIYCEKVLGLSEDERHGLPMFFVPVAISLSEADSVAHTADAAKEAIRAWAARRGVEPPPVVLVVIDTLARNIGGDAHESDNADMSRVMNHCALLQRRLAALDLAMEEPTVLLNAHPGHGDKTRIRGAYAVQGAIDVALRIEVEAQTQALAAAADDPELERTLAEILGGPVPVAQPRVLRVTKARDSAYPSPMRLRFMQESPPWLRDRETGDDNSTVYLAANAEFDPVDGSPQRANRKVSDEQIAAVLAANPGISQTRLAGLLGISRPTLAARLRARPTSGGAQ